MCKIEKILKYFIIILQSYIRKTPAVRRFLQFAQVYFYFTTPLEKTWLSDTSFTTYNPDGAFRRSNGIL